MNWFLLFEIIYILAIILVCLRIIYDTRSTTKTLAYLLLVIFVPLLGMIIYFTFGVNYRKRKIYSKKLIANEELSEQLRQNILKYSQENFLHARTMLEPSRELAFMLANDAMSPLTAGNSVKLLINGENKFPEVIRAIQQAKKFIHIEYYIYEDGEIGRTLENLLIQKVNEGVEVRFIYDDFGSRSIRRKQVPRLRKAGVQTFPFYKVNFLMFANRLNYRNHRKIIVVDGEIGFVGGINVSDRYINHPDNPGKLYWRDTHVMIEGPGVHYLQYLFLCDWNFCAEECLVPNDDFFPPIHTLPQKDNKMVQIAASGPDSDTPTVLFSMLQAIHLASEEILITTPYFIPGESILDALIVSALGGVSVKLLVPKNSDSFVVDAAARSYYEDLLDAGVEIYLYHKGFVHAKTMVTDRKTAIVGTANMDNRSFDLNFEVNAIIYDEAVANELRQIFFDDLQHAEKLSPETWRNRPVTAQMLEKTARLVSPLL